MGNNPSQKTQTFRRFLERLRQGGNDHIEGTLLGKAPQSLSCFNEALSWQVWQASFLFAVFCCDEYLAGIRSRSGTWSIPRRALMVPLRPNRIYPRNSYRAVPYLVDFEVAESFCESQGLVNREKHY